MAMTENINVENIDGLTGTINPDLDKERELSIKAHSKREALNKATAWVNDLAQVGIASHVEYNGIEIPADQTVTEGGDVHSVTLIIEGEV